MRKTFHMHAYSHSARIFAGVCLFGVMACHGLLDASNPTVVQDSDIANASGANARRLNVVYHFYVDVSLAANDVALFTDERTYDQNGYFPKDPNLALDQRNSTLYEQLIGTQQDIHLGELDDVIARSAVAIPSIRANAADSVKDDFLAQLFAMRGYAILQMAEDICSGFPINDVLPNNQPVYSGPYTTDSAVAYGIVQLDSALAHGRDSTQFIDFASVVKGRALLNLGQYAEAAAAVSNVPTTFVYEVDSTSSANFFNVNSGVFDWSVNPMAVGDREGGNGLPFVSAQDPRVPTVFVQTRFDTPADSLYDQLKYPTSRTPMVLASGIEARLIEAEAALNAGDPTWLTILNTLRSTAITPAMAPLTDPGTTSARVDLLYGERAFWLYLTGRRLGDLRRLIRNYGRDPQTVFPTGNHPVGGIYSTGTAIPFITAVYASYNAQLAGGCTSR